MMALLVIWPAELPSAGQANSAERIDVLDNQSPWRYHVAGRPQFLAVNAWSYGMYESGVTRDGGCILLTNRGDSRFLNTPFEAGEVEYNVQARIVDGANCDINNDGRQDFVLFYQNTTAQTFFHRGFRCFGYAVEMGLDRYDLPAALAAEDGQQAGTVADFNGDGAQDLMFVATSGQVWLLLRGAERGPKLGVPVAMSPVQTGPISVVGFDRDRCLGAQRITAGLPAFFGRRNKGPIRLQRQSQPKQTRQVIVLKPTRFQLPGE